MNHILSRIVSGARVFWYFRLESPRHRAERHLRMAENMYHDCARNEAPYYMLAHLRERMEHERAVVDMYRDAYREAFK